MEAEILASKVEIKREKFTLNRILERPTQLFLNPPAWSWKTAAGLLTGLALAQWMIVLAFFQTSLSSVSFDETILDAQTKALIRSAQNSFYFQSLCNTVFAAVTIVGVIGLVSLIYFEGSKLEEADLLPHFNRGLIGALPFLISGMIPVSGIQWIGFVVSAVLVGRALMIDQKSKEAAKS